MEHLYVAFGVLSCIGFLDILRINKVLQTDKQTNDGDKLTIPTVVGVGIERTFLCNGFSRTSLTYSLLCLFHLTVNDSTRKCTPILLQKYVDENSENVYCRSDPRETQNAANSEVATVR